MTDGGALPTVRSTLRTRYVHLLLFCKSCRHQAPADLEALAKGGRGDATAAGFWVYAISYGSPASGCSTDTAPTITPCATLLAIASDPTKFYADTTAACPAGANPTSGLTNLFQNIGTSLTASRMLPDNTN